MTTLEVFDPSGALEITRLHAARLDGLEGKRIGIVSNDEWQAHRTLPLAAELLQQANADLTVIPASEFPMGNQLMDSDETVERAKAEKLDAVLVGNAA